MKCIKCRRELKQLKGKYKFAVQLANDNKKVREELVREEKA